MKEINTIAYHSANGIRHLVTAPKISGLHVDAPKQKPNKHNCCIAFWTVNSVRTGLTDFSN